MGQPLAMPLTSWPVWQNGMPQSMQRAPCFFRSAPACGVKFLPVRGAPERGARSCWKLAFKFKNPSGCPYYFSLGFEWLILMAALHVLFERGHDRFVAGQALRLDRLSEVSTRL